MRIDRLKIANFKRFEHLVLDLHPRFTLLVGDNASGKTSVLDALAVAAGIWLEELPDSTLRNSRRNILPTEIRLKASVEGDRTQFTECKPVIVDVCGEIAGQPVSWKRQIREGGTRTTNAEAKTALDIITGLYQRDRQGERVLCPVIAYYGAGRAWLPSNKRSDRAAETAPARRWEAFYDCFDERIRLGDLQGWFRREAIAAANRGGKWRPGYEVVKRAVLHCLPEADDLWFDGDRSEIVAMIAGQAQPFGLMSAGQKMMVALVADIAIKAVTQNAYLLPPDQLGTEDEPWPRILRQTPGLVLIDELDVHLHPKWQRRVVQDLKAAFQTMQFVATTHSPQTVGEAHPEEIRLMFPGNEAVEIPSIAYGADSNWILDHVIPDAASRNRDVQELLDAVEALLDGGKLDDAERLLAETRARMTGEDGELTRLQSSLDTLRMLAHEDN